MIKQDNLSYSYLDFPAYVALSEGWNEYYDEIIPRGIAFEGYTSPAKQYMMSALILNTNCKLFYEIGLNLGHCAFRLLNTLKATGGKLLSFEIDETKRSVENSLLKIFPENYLGTVWGNSIYTLSLQKEKADIIHIDGGHTEEVFYKDFENSLKVIKKDGILVIDDAQQEGEIYAFLERNYPNQFTFFPDPVHNVPFAIMQVR